MTVYLDLDGTLFDARAYSRAFWAMAEEQLSIDRQAAMADTSRYYSAHESGMDWYNFSKHTASRGIGPEMTMTVLEGMAGQSFLYGDVGEALSYLAQKYTVEILTFGDESYQKSKLRQEPLLAHYPAHIVASHKKNFLEALSEPSILVDDKDLREQLPPEVQFILIDREAADPILEHTNGGYTINSLGRLQDILSQP